MWKNTNGTNKGRRYKLPLQYYTKLISSPQNPAFNCIMEIRYKNLFENKSKAIKPFNLRIQTLLNKIKINPKIIHNTILPKNKTMDHEPTNNKARTNETIQNQNTPHHFPREFPQHPKQLPRSPPHLYKLIQTGNESWLCGYLPKQRIAKISH